MIAFPFHTIELMNKFRHPRPAHAMKRHVPIFQATGRVRNVVRVVT